jgi:hypothetical protein
MKYYLISVSGHGPDDGYTRLLGGLQIADGKYILATTEDIEGALKQIRLIPGEAKAEEISASHYEDLSRDALPVVRSAC